MVMKERILSKLLNKMLDSSQEKKVSNLETSFCHSTNMASSGLRKMLTLTIFICVDAYWQILLTLIKIMFGRC